ncbi:MAG: translation initiation factor IF-3 [Fusobacterium perfoetens]|uniref:translation initiation factor IF-3 n=1 Tax=Fusobacterium perfoetens TaxID=852 RepID=UPI0023F43110|nr:translation initiation factor IF-3 [Fusobacterium perfoetens]MCI6152607.1 translation initiation factor IF-3 [Fusobacterium perfoetens]MDY3237614.1 translation initiation factor IF-3 [Fusobacterium perfoetens]
MSAISDKIRINEKIKGKEFRIISNSGEQMGIMTAAEALEAARRENLDLVEISPNANPPVCKIMDFGKYKYEQTRKAKDAKKKQKQVVVKEVKLRTRIDTHDLETKINSIKKFLEKDNKVKVTLVQFGRERSYEEMGIELLDDVASQFEGFAEVEKRYKDAQKYLMLSLKK